MQSHVTVIIMVHCEKLIIKTCNVAKTTTTKKSITEYVKSQSQMWTFSYEDKKKKYFCCRNVSNNLHLHVIFIIHLHRGALRDRWVHENIHTDMLQEFHACCKCK